MTQPAATEGQPAQGAQGQPQGTEKQPPWADGEFDAERAWKKIQALEADKEKLAKRPVLDDAAKTALAEYEKLKAASQTDLEKAQGELTRWQTDAEKWRTAAVSSKIQALAASEFEYPEDAVNALDPAKYLDASGVINEDAIKSDLKGLLDARPNWKRGDGARAPRPNQHQGSGGTGKTSSDPAQDFATILQSQLTR